MQRAEYLFKIGHPNFKVLKYINYFLVFFSVSVFLYTATLFTSTLYFYGIISFLIILNAIYNFFRKQYSNPFLIWYAPLLFCVIGWFHPEQGNYFIGILILASVVFQYYALKPQYILFYRNNISISGIPSKNIPWKSIDHIILKDGILTIGYNNNRYLQREITELKSSSEEDAFNQFCQSSLAFSK